MTESSAKAAAEAMLGEKLPKRGIFAEVERDIKRPLRVEEHARISGLFLANLLPADRRKRKRCARRALEEARQAEGKANGG
jgi:hypothetical protein